MNCISKSNLKEWERSCTFDFPWSRIHKISLTLQNLVLLLPTIPRSSIATFLKHLVHILFIRKPSHFLRRAPSVARPCYYTVFVLLTCGLTSVATVSSPVFRTVGSVNLLPAFLILYGISPYTGITFCCPHYKCDDMPESANTIASLISGIIIAL